MEQACTLIEKDDWYFVVAKVKTTHPVWVESGAVVRVNNDISDDLLGHTVELILDETRHNVPMDLTVEEIPSVVKAAKARSYSIFARNALRVSITRRDGVLTISPLRHRGRAIFDLVAEHEVTCAEIRGAELGSLLRQALAHSQS